MVVPGCLSGEQWCIFRILCICILGGIRIVSTAWAVTPLSSCSCSHFYGRGTAVGPQSGEWCWPLLDRLWTAIAPLMKPWCADKWKGKSCPSNDGHSCWLGHGDILVMDGQCQDEFRHCTDPGSDQERINITFRWVKQHVASCSFLRTGVACCLPTCARGFSFSGTEVMGKGSFFLSFWLLLGILCILGVLALLVTPLVCTWFGFPRCGLLLDTPSGQRSVGALSLLPLGSLPGSTKNCQSCLFCFLGFYHLKLYMLALVRRPSLHSYDACMVYRVQGASRRTCRRIHGKTSFSPRTVFLFSRNLQNRFWGLVFWYL